MQSAIPPQRQIWWSGGVLRMLVLAAIVFCVLAAGGTKPAQRGFRRGGHRSAVWCERHAHPGRARSRPLGHLRRPGADRAQPADHRSRRGAVAGAAQCRRTPAWAGAGAPFQPADAGQIALRGRDGATGPHRWRHPAAALAGQPHLPAGGRRRSRPQRGIGSRGAAGGRPSRSCRRSPTPRRRPHR